jgi:hypothetical protein
MKFLRAAMVIAFSILSCVRVSPAPKQSDQNPPKSNETKFLSPETIQGCYELGVLNWKPDLKLGEDSVFITPPPRIQISAERGSIGFEKNGYIVRAAPGLPKSIYRDSYWEPAGSKSIEIVFSTGTSGLTMRLRLDGETLRGKAKTHWDFRRRGQTALVNAPKIDCASSK